MSTEQLTEIAQNGKDWVDYLSALLTPTIAILGSIIAFLQWWTNRKRLKHELFDRRYAQFEVIAAFLASTISSGKSRQDEQYKYLVGTRGLRFTFDKETEKYASECIYKPSLLLDTLEKEAESLPVGSERSENHRRQREIRHQLNEEFEHLEEKFSQYLQLRH